MAYLILVRHGQSEWNALGKWTGLTDVPLTKQGRLEAQKAAMVLRDIPIHAGHTSTLSRAKESLEEIKKALKLTHLPVVEHKALNERDYGELTGKNKWKIKEEHGDEQFHNWRRGWEHKPPKGESLKDVHARVLPYFQEHILKDLREGKNVIVSSHGNTLRALIKHLDALSDDDVRGLEVGTGDVHVYTINESGIVTSKEIRVHNDFNQ